MNFFGDGTLILSLGKTSGTGAGVPPPPPASSPLLDMSSESLLLELSGLPGGAAPMALLDEPFCGDTGNQPGVTVPVFASSSADSARSCCALSQASCLSASSIEKGSFAVALMYRPLSSLARSFPFSGPVLRSPLLLGPWDPSILTC